MWKKIRKIRCEFNDNIMHEIPEANTAESEYNFNEFLEEHKSDSYSDVQ